ncbi:MAG: hypothetical protein HDR20_14300 [Lachnospiraceae bacterium]|nr:hypothetical protein [Lachnospiraceae bacterium]
MKISLRAIILAVVLSLTGYSQSIQEKELSPVEQEEATAVSDRNEVSSFWFQMTTFYGDTNGNDFDGGYLQSGSIKIGDKAVLVKSDGTSYETSIQRIALYDAEDKIHPIPTTEVEDDSLTFVWLEGIESDQLQYDDILLGTKEWEQGIPMDFPFEKPKEYSLTLAPQENEEGSGELRLYDKEGEVLQRIAYGVFTEPDYYVLCKNDRRNLVLFPDKESSAGRFLEWDGSRFLELGTDIKRGQTPSSDDLLLTEETASKLTREIYRPHRNDREAEVIRSYTLQKETGELEIWDCLDKKSLFHDTVSLDDEGAPINKEYYEVLFTEGLYFWEGEAEEGTVPVDLRLKSSDEIDTEYASREAFLSDYGFTGSDPIYEYYDSLGNLRLEVYRDEDIDLFCGIVYRYYYNSDKQKVAALSGFVVDDIKEGEWEDDTYSIMSSIDSYGYEEKVEFTSDERPKYFLATGRDEIESDDGEIVTMMVTMMEIDYIYRDDGTLYQRDYRHNPRRFSTYRQSESSLYDEKERLVFEDAYITHGILQDYYVYLDEGNKPAYHIELDYAGGSAPITSIERY